MKPIRALETSKKSPLIRILNQPTIYEVGFTPFTLVVLEDILPVLYGSYLHWLERYYHSQGTTFGGNHLACAAVEAVLDVFESESLLNNVNRVGNYLLDELRSIEGVKEVRGQGLMIGVEFDEPVKDIRHRLLFEEHVFTGVSGTNIIRLLPPLTLTIEQAMLFIDKFKKVITSR